ncbi:hypothetical protein [Rhizobium leguminosarum]|uniref:hypothetical protein n=1 Tax=Rhizobium leguminosarum TaxID=384 RepID=UPI0014425D97|nr:hypothetical protein [Rhizobium leguminosarum]
MVIVRSFGCSKGQEMGCIVDDSNLGIFQKFSDFLVCCKKGYVIFGTGEQQYRKA